MKLTEKEGVGKTKRLRVTYISDITFSHCHQYIISSGANTILNVNTIGKPPCGIQNIN